VLGGPKPTNGLFHVDGARIGRVAGTAKCEQPLPRVGATAKEVDQDCGVQENRCQLPHAAVIRPPLVANPPARILVPFMTTVGDRAHSGLEQFPALILVKGTLDGACDVRAAAAGADAAIQLVDELIGKRNVHSHGHNLTHLRRYLRCFGQGRWLRGQPSQLLSEAVLLKTGRLGFA
jgi:hypothetical protein